MAHEMSLIEQTELQLESNSLALTKMQVACLRAIRRGVRSKAQIAIAAQLDLANALKALNALLKFRLVKKTRKHEWLATERGKNCQFKTIADKKRRGSNAIGAGAQRLINALDRPISGTDLAIRLGITRQRVHQLVVKLHASGHLRIGDPERVLHVIARTDDSTPLLSRSEQRVFSAIPDEYWTTAKNIRLAANSAEAVSNAALKHLLKAELITKNRNASGAIVYQVTKAGSEHAQYGQSVQRAEPPALPVRSNRVLDVLSLFAERGCVQITEIRDTLGITHRSINALVQYLKRKSLIHKDGSGPRSPYLLTDIGREVLVEMYRRRTM